MVPSEPADPKQRPQLWRASQPVRLHHLLGNEHPRRGGSLYETGESQLVSSGHEYPHWRHLLFQRSPVDEVSCPLLPTALAVMAGDVLPRPAVSGSTSC